MYLSYTSSLMAFHLRCFVGIVFYILSQDPQGESPQCVTADHKYLVLYYSSSTKCFLHCLLRDDDLDIRQFVVML